MSNHEGSASSLSAEEIARLGNFALSYGCKDVLDRPDQPSVTGVYYTALDEHGISEYLETQAPDGMVESWTSR